jgi:hypothetical protein
MRKLTMVAAALVAAATGLVPAGAATSAASACELTWGSLPEQQSAYGTGHLTNVRAGRHECFDRLVIDLGPGLPPGYHVSYVTEVRQDFTGDPVPLAGGAFLNVSVLAPAYDDDYRATYAPADRMRAVNAAGYSTLRQVAWLGSAEATSQLGVGVRARLPFRAFRLDGPGGGSRLVIDIAHRW